MVVNPLETVFQINPQLEIPIYQQLVDHIRAAVKMGKLAPGEKLPTVQELSEQLSIARGTIKRAYDELEHLGILEKVQGRGTFICDQPQQSGAGGLHQPEGRRLSIHSSPDGFNGTGKSGIICRGQKRKSIL